MNQRPLSITIISWIFVAVGTLSLLNDLQPLVSDLAARRFSDVQEAHPLAHSPIWAIHAASLVGGVFLLRGRNWARWLLVLWMAFHIGLSFLHSYSQLIVHGVLFGVVSYFLFRPRASAYFRGGERLA